MLSTESSYHVAAGYIQLSTKQLISSRERFFVSFSTHIFYAKFLEVLSLDCGCLEQEQRFCW